MYKVTYLKQSDILKCPFAIMMPEHYNDDGSCRCSDPDHRAMMIRDWEYTKADFEAADLLMDLKKEFPGLEGEVL